MAGKTPLQKAKKYLRQRKFPKVISLLQPLVLDYRDSFDFFFTLGTACLYLEDIGGAEAYYRSARKLKANNVDIKKAQAALYLRLGEVARAVEYYLDVLDSSPSDRQAKAALQFIRKNSGKDGFDEKIRFGAVRDFYPALGMNPAIPSVFAVCAVIAVAGVLFGMNYKTILGLNGARADLSELELTREEKLHPVSGDLSNGVYRYIMTNDEVVATYESAKKAFQQYRDNEARKAINMILNSNAEQSVKVHAEQLAQYLKEPLYDSVKDNYTVRQVLEDVWLYDGCWVQWSGRVSNVETDDRFYRCSFLVGYENLDRIDATVTLVFEQPVAIDGNKPLTVLGSLGVSDGQLILWGRAVHQPVE